MINRVLKSALLGLALVAFAATAFAQTPVSVTLDPTQTWNGFMNVYNLPAPAGDGAFQFPSSWGTADLCAVFTGTSLRLSPNTINDPNPYWYTPAGGPGSTGNKIMEANMYVQSDGGLANTVLTFSGTVTSNTLTAAHVAKIFIRDFAPDFSTFNETAIPMPASGPFSISLTTVNDVARHVQYGFQVKGPDVWVTDLAPYGAVVIDPTEVTPTAKESWGKLKSQYR